VFMPLCCCKLHIVGGCLEGAAAITQQSQSCCSKCVSSDEDGEPADEDRSGRCTGCCTKFAGGSLDWSPPVDKIGTDLPAWSLPTDTLEADEVDAASTALARAGPVQRPPRLTSLVAMRCALVV